VGGREGPGLPQRCFLHADQVRVGRFGLGGDGRGAFGEVGRLDLAVVGGDRASSWEGVTAAIASVSSEPWNRL
jgi:hypothetical protein